MKIPDTATTYETAFGSHKQHVRFETDNECEDFCAENNVGWHDGARQDVRRGFRQVFAEADAKAFNNFPSRKG